MVGWPWPAAMCSLCCSHTPSSTEQGQKIRWKSSWTKIKVRRTLTNYCQEEKKMPFGKKPKKPKYIAKVDLDGGKQKLNTLPSPVFFSPASTALCHSQLLYLPNQDWCMGMGNRWLGSAHERSSPHSCLLLFLCSSVASPGTAGNSVQAHGTPPPPPPS